MSRRIASRIFDGSADPLPPGPVVLGGYVVIVAATLAFAGIVGWFGVVAIAVVLLVAIVLIVRAGTWPAAHSDIEADGAAAPPTVGS